MGNSMKKTLNILLNPQLEVSEHFAGSAVLTNSAKLSLYKKSRKSNISAGILEEVFYRGYAGWEDIHGGTAEQAGFNRVNSFIAGGGARSLDKDLSGWSEAPEAPATTLDIVRKVIREAQGN